MSYNESESEIKEPKSKAIKSKRQGSRNVIIFIISREVSI